MHRQIAELDDELDRDEQALVNQVQEAALMDQAG